MTMISRASGLDARIQQGGARLAGYLPPDFHRKVADGRYSGQNLRDAQHAYTSAMAHGDWHGAQAARRLVSDLGAAISTQSGGRTHREGMKDQFGGFGHMGHHHHRPGGWHQNVHAMLFNPFQRMHGC